MEGAVHCRSPGEENADGMQPARVRGMGREGEEGRVREEEEWIQENGCSLLSGLYFCRALRGVIL